MTIEKTEILFSGDSGEKTVDLDFLSNNSCMQAGFSVISGRVSVKGRLCGEDEDHQLGFIDLRTGDIRTTAGEGVYSLLGCEYLKSVTFTASEETEALLKCLY